MPDGRQPYPPASPIGGLLPCGFCLLSRTRRWEGDTWRAVVRVRGPRAAARRARDRPQQWLAPALVPIALLSTFFARPQCGLSALRDRPHRKASCRLRHGGLLLL